MKQETLFIGHSIQILEEVNSTNSFALELIKQAPVHEGYVIWAKKQSAGRGQRGNAWHSEALANLTFSIILRPKFLPIAEQFQLTKAIALGIAGFVSHCLYDVAPLGEDYTHVKIKWPNDIYVKKSKIAGILIENVVEHSTIKYSVVGIGLNINQVIFDSSVPNPASLKMLTGREFNLADCLKHLCSFIEKYYLDLLAHRYPQLDEAYHNLLYRQGIWSGFILKGETIKGEIQGVNRAGQLVLMRKGNQGHRGEGVITVSDSKQLVFL